jgi:hypothetical protein
MSVPNEMIVCPSCSRDTGEDEYRDSDWYGSLYSCSTCGFKFFAHPNYNDGDLEPAEPSYWYSNGPFGPEVAAMKSETRAILSRAAIGLSKRQLEVLKFRFGLDGYPQETLEEVGLRYYVGKERIRRIQNDALRRLRVVLVGLSTSLERLMSEGDRLL